MARGRMISRDLSLSESFAALSPFARTFWILAIVNMDDFGIAPTSPARLKAQVCPLFSETPRDVAEAVAQLAAAGMIEIYTVSGTYYLRAPRFDEYQTGLHKRTRSRFPTRAEGSNAEPSDYLAAVVTIPDSPGTSRKFPEVPSQQNRTELNGTEEEQEENYSPTKAGEAPQGVEGEASGPRRLRVKKEKVFPEDSIEVRLARRLFNHLSARVPGRKEPNWPSWYSTFDAILRLDRRDPAEVARVIDWAQRDTFWRKNIASAESLRAKYDRLVDEAGFHRAAARPLAADGDDMTASQREMLSIMGGGAS